MTTRRYSLTALLLALSSLLPTQAVVRLPRFFADGMVMQQQTPCNLWGTARAHHRVTIRTSWDRHTYKVTTDGDGRWRLKIHTPSAGGPYTISLDDGQPTLLRNIMVGELWLCAGQSNMEMPMKGFKGQPVDGATEELMAAADSRLRLFTVRRNARWESQNDVDGTWNETRPETLRQFSATAYYFGKALRRSLQVPVGLIVTSWGGSACEAWMAPDWLKAFPSVRLPSSQADVDQTLQRCPTALYQGMLRPLVGLTMRGAIWYQGEDNVNRAASYARLLQHMVAGWRHDWQQGDFPFYYCQIAPYDYSLIQWDYNSAYLREQQLMAEQLIPNSRMAVLMDAGLKYGIHPRQKRTAGERLALLALSHTYGVQGLPDFATYKAVEWKGDTAVISFDRSREWVYFAHGPHSDNFEIAGADRRFHPAKAWIERNHVYVCSPEVQHPQAVRYAFHDWAEGDLCHDGLPVSSFRTDHW